MPTLNEILHRIAGVPLHDPVHADIDAAVPPEKDTGEEDSTDAQV